MALGFRSGEMRNRLLMKFFALFCASFVAGVLFLHSTIRLNTSVVSNLSLGRTLFAFIIELLIP